METVERAKSYEIPQRTVALSELLEGVGASILAAPRGADLSHEVGSVAIYEPGVESELGPASVVLLVGVEGQPNIVSAASLLRGSGVRVVVVRGTPDYGADDSEVASRSGVTMLSASRGVSWADLTGLIQRALSVPGSSRQVGSEGDLFTFANAVSALLDAPITIEDRNSHVIAFSGRQEEGDDSRIATVLERQVPDQYLRLIEEAGIFDQIYRSREPVWISGASLGTRLDRVAVAIRAGDEYLGSIWAAVDGNLTLARTRALADSAQLVAVRMIELRTAADPVKRRQSELLADLVEGGSAAISAMERAGLGSGSAMVIALGRRSGLHRDRPDGTAHLGRLVDAFAVHLGAVYGQSVVAMINGIGYAVVALPSRSHGADADAARISSDFLERVGAHGDTIIGVGRVMSRPEDLGRSRRDADHALDILRTRRIEGCVATFRSVYVDALLLQVSRESAAEGFSLLGPLTAIARHDDEHSTVYLSTLEAWLSAFGDIGAASASLHVHPNTFRYRLSKLRSLQLFDLDDADARFRLMVHLRIRHLQ
ncbi:helix-turn-helix domain-containing protein [Rhodococcus erythropolis]|uniref:PucR family transcriptional regulator n=1 Tax=Rhodococcus erythropolis TaxID=1833 RepID=UPI001E2FC0D4|nr:MULTISPECIES: helix-turn-helix domain-containing protein [Rhodococcus erythropolis group]MCD2104040.1 helix-turn-helix domain-containing protein [Rhodococcus qingshengii]MCZ4523093.1 helix-turn-helix domain-containing protein [Rhodococcus erythropolis]